VTLATQNGRPNPTRISLSRWLKLTWVSCGAFWLGL